MTPQPGSLDILVILDRSGSMVSKRADHEGGLRSFVTDQKSLDGDVRFTLVQFDTNEPCHILYDRVKIQDVDADTIVLIPRGGTPLLDAVGKATAHLEAKQVDDPTERTVVMIITDGEENSSTEWTKDRVKERLKAIEAKDGTVLFLGADIDAFSEAAHLGVPMAMAMGIASAVPDSTGKAYGYTSANLMRSRAVRQDGGSTVSAAYAMSFTADQREDVDSGTEFDASKIYGGTGSFHQYEKSAEKSADVFTSTTTNTKDDGHTVTVTNEKEDK